MVKIDRVCPGSGMYAGSVELRWGTCRCGKLVPVMGGRVVEHLA